MLIIGKGTPPGTVNDVTIAFDKEILADLDKNRPTGGYPPEQEKAIKETRDRVAAYEATHGTVDPVAISDAQEAHMAAGLALLSSVVAGMHAAAPAVTIAPPLPSAMRPRRVHAAPSRTPRPTPPAPPAPVAVSGTPVDMDKVYVVRLVEGDGDIHTKLVNGATFNFVKNGGRFPRNQIDAYIDGPDLKQAQEDLIRIDKNLATMTESERASNVLPDKFDGETLSGYNVSSVDLADFVASHGLELASNEYEGYAL